MGKDNFDELDARAKKTLSIMGVDHSDVNGIARLSFSDVLRVPGTGIKTSAKIFEYAYRNGCDEALICHGFWTSRGELGLRPRSGLSARVENIIRRMGIIPSDVDSIARVGRNRILLEWSGGKKAVAEIEEYLKRHDLTLSD